MDCSIVVSTRDRAERLRRCLGAIARIRSDHEWELVVVDNGSTDGTQEVLDAFEERAPVPVTRRFESQPGLGRARNLGCRAARGEVIAVTDDDCYPEPDYVTEVMEVFARHRVGYIGGRILLHDPSDAEITVRPETEPELLPAHYFPRAGFVQGANMAFRRSVFADIGGFDPAMGAGTPYPCEDIDFCARASDRGWNGGYFPGPTVRHHHGRKPGPDVRRLRRLYHQGRGGYYAKTLLDCPTLRISCLKWWYWSLSSQDPGATGREVAYALRFGADRAIGKLPGRSNDRGEDGLRAG